ncbi:hypothetical protein EW146_g6578 [Bondarzewia mesenterica]|uniref:Protein HRI1 n=1 Tax=Bondarzewia mesenterica TaxID=1095465 RepID=A0A4S4LNC4_9AGAM|nr:hypothetical protein EW146_g6578 [Bondarzewia mesenterica]
MRATKRSSVLQSIPHRFLRNSNHAPCYRPFPNPLRALSTTANSTGSTLTSSSSKSASPTSASDVNDPTIIYRGPLASTFKRLKIFSLSSLTLSFALSPFIFIIESGLPLSARAALAGIALGTSGVSTALVSWPFARWTLASAVQLPEDEAKAVKAGTEETIAESKDAKGNVLGRWVVKWEENGEGNCRAIGPVVKHFNVHEEFDFVMGIPSISERRSIRWVPGEASELTSTLVLTSQTSHFVDIRVLKPPQDHDPKVIDEGSRLEWAFAGTSHSEPGKGDGAAPIHSRWEHWVDSNSDTPATDEGDIWTLPNGDTLEKGRMVNPETGELTDYEEVWADAEVERTGQDSKRVCVVLNVEDNEMAMKGMVIRVGGWCQGILKVGKEVSVERWKWVGKSSASGTEQAGGGWERVAKVGIHTPPCTSTFAPDKLEEGNVVDARWKVSEKYEW